jgi:ribosome-associated protein
MARPKPKEHRLQPQENLTAKNQPKGPKKVADLLECITTSLDDDQAVEMVTIDLKGKTSIADYMIIASGRSQRHASAIADHLIDNLKAAGFGTPKVEGLRQADWVLLDAGDIIVHVFRPEVRSFYNLEKMWSIDINEDDLTDVEIKT